MSEKGERPENAPHRNEWEVVSLTASAYEASPGSNETELKNDHKDSPYYDAETSQALFMSGHFVFPPSEHEDLPLESKFVDTTIDEVDNDGDPEFDSQRESLFIQRDDVPLNPKKLNLPDDATQTRFSDVNDGKEHNIYEALNHDDESRVSDASHVVRPAKDIRHAGNLPCEAWWRRRISSLYTHSKEANALWSVVIAAAVTGLVILGQHWQRERWQVLQLKWQSSIGSERTSRVLGSISRLKDVIASGNRRGSFISGSTSGER